MASSSRDGVTDDDDGSGSPTVSSDAVVATTLSDHVQEDTMEQDEPVMDSPPQSSPFQEGEKVLAYSSRFVYEAKIEKVDRDASGWRYFVHYRRLRRMKSDGNSSLSTAQGWKKSWDEWVRIHRLMKNTVENRQKLQDPRKKEEMENNANTGKKPKISSGAKGRKRKTGPAPKEKAMPSTEKHVNIPIPPALKKQLIDDWESVKESDKLVKLPRSPNVNEILSQYQDYRLKKDTRLAGSVEEIVNGLRCYFDKALPAMLLYNNERQQYEEAIANNLAPSALYGAEHLLRLFVKLPEMLQNADIEEKLLPEFQQNMVDFVKFLQKNQASFFLGGQQSSEKLDSSEKQED